MSALISQSELKQCLQKLNVELYYVLIDMRGTLTLILSPDQSIPQSDIINQIDKIHNERKLDNTTDMIYPFIGIEIDADTDTETNLRFKDRLFVITKYTQQLNTWKIPMSSDESADKNGKPYCVTFYSYKGGVGGSTALAIVARLLAGKGHKVAVIDLDLEAPGLNSLMLTKAESFPFGVVDYLYHKPWMKERLNKEEFIDKYIVKAEVKQTLRPNDRLGQLWIMSAGGMTPRNKNVKNSDLLFADADQVDLMLDPNYLQKLSYIDFDLYARDDNNVFSELLKDVANYTNADIILLDARTGISNVGGALLHKFSDLVSIHVQDNKQNREGIALLIEQLGRQDISLLQKVIWSQTKVSRFNKRSKEELEIYIKTLLDNQFKIKQDLNESCDNKYEIEGVLKDQKELINEKELIDEIVTKVHMLPFLDDLEDVSAEALKEMIEDESMPLGYKKLAEEIARETGLDTSMSLFNVTPEEKIEIYSELSELLSINKPNSVFISTRFLDPSLKWFVGFPGSGKKTFYDYLKNESSAVADRVKIIGFQEFNAENVQTHQVLSNSIFLDWSLSEAAQAACKYLLWSKALYELIKKKSKDIGNLQIDSLENMRLNAVYELPKESVEDILNLVFGKRKLRRGPSSKFNMSWIEMFKRIQYREGYVLPRDWITTIRSTIDYFVNLEDQKNRNDGQERLIDSGSALFPNLNPIRLNKILQVIGVQKKNWLNAYDERLIKLIEAYRGELNFLSMSTKESGITRDELATEVQSSFKKFGYSANDFDEVLLKAQSMRIVSIEGEFFKLSPVYNLIPENPRF